MNKEQYERLGKEIRKNPAVLDGLPEFYRIVATKLWLEDEENQKLK